MKSILKDVFIPGPAGSLEAKVAYPQEGVHPFVAILCHPNPVQEGTMENKVVTTLSRAFEQLGLMTVRFNFRGVGASEGEFGEIVGEIEDLKAVVHWVQKKWPYKEVWLAGFSFGSYIAACVANENQQISQLINIAPAADRHDYTRLTNVRCPWLVVASDSDEVVPFKQVQDWLAHFPVPFTFLQVTGASHFFHGRLIELRELIKQHFSLLLDRLI